MKIERDAPVLVLACPTIRKSQMRAVWIEIAFECKDGITRECPFEEWRGRGIAAACRIKCRWMGADPDVTLQTSISDLNLIQRNLSECGAISPEQDEIVGERGTELSGAVWCARLR